MKLLILSASVAVGLFSLSQGHPTRSSVVHEKRDNIPPEWTKLSRPTPDTAIELRIGLRQNNIDHAEELVKQISHPKSDKYGQFLTAQQVVDLFAAPKEVLLETVQWLRQGGINSKLIKPTAGRNWLKFNTTVAVAEKLLDTTYYTYRNEEEGVELIACESYSVPEDIQPNIDLIMPTIHFDTQGSSSSNRGLRRRDGWSPSPDSLDHCGEMMTPACLRAEYSLPDSGEAVEGNSYGIVQFAPSGYDQGDLNLFYSTLAPNVPNNTAPILEKIDGGYLSSDEDSSNRGEPNLDLTIAIGLVHPQPVTLYQVGDNYFIIATNNNFLDAIDGSYCTYDGGDDPAYDAQYPHDESFPGAYTGENECGTHNATHVISISYGSNEADRSIAYRSRECHEYLKLGLMGVTVLFASGDTGVATASGRCYNPDGSVTPRGADYGQFSAAWPGSCPWITAVGGSAYPPNGTVGDKQVASWNFPSSGGFSNYFAMPDYQKDAIKTFFAEHEPPYDSSRYNNSQQARGYPDLALSSERFMNPVAGEFIDFTGTSAAAPLLGAMITLINGERIKNGKGPVGFLNPLLYAHPEIFDDVTEGASSGCGTTGFSAGEGWDAVTGLGVPNFPKMKELLVNLP